MSNNHVFLKKLTGLVAAVLIFCVPASAIAAPDEIQVYTDDMNEPGQYGVELHLNYVPDGSTTPAHPGAMLSNHRFQATPEFSYGFSKSWEGGMYVPFAVSGNGETYANGLRLRLKYIAPQPPESTLFWGLNTEFGYSATRVSDGHWSMEVRPILGIRKNGWMFAINPIIDIPVSHGGLSGAAFEPSIKLSRELSKGLEVGLEHYSSFGPINHLEGWSKQEHSIYAVADFQVKGMEVNFGVGRGYHNAEDEWVVKAIVAFPFN